MKLYTKEQLIKKYSGRFIDTYPHHYEVKNKNGDFVTVYEVRSVKKTIWENHNQPEEV